MGSDDSVQGAKDRIVMGHIMEGPNDELDYDTFFTHGIPEGITDEEWRARIGQRTWALYHGVMDHYPCETCKQAGQVLMSGIHDMVNIHTGKGIFDLPKWKQFVKYVKEASAKVHAQHTPQQSHLKHAIMTIAPKHQVGH